MTDAPTPRDVGAASLILEMNKWHGAYPAFSEAQAYMDAILSAITAWNIRAQSDVERELLGACKAVLDPNVSMGLADKMLRRAIARATGGGA